MIRTTTALLLLMLAILTPAKASALIFGGKGNQPLDDRGWPRGAAAIFDHPGRVAWWEGPPFGGGEWHAECRGDARALSGVLADFAKLDVKSKRVVVHEGAGHSFWLGMSDGADKPEAAGFDWEFMVWTTKSWEQQRKLPARFDATEPGDTEPPARIDVYTAGIRWSDVVVPAGIKVVDERLAAHGFSADDGSVTEGRVTDLATGQPIAATMRLEREVQSEEHGRSYSLIARSKADAHGRWLLKHVPTGAAQPNRGRESFRVVVEADGFVPRVAGSGQFDGKARWKSYDAGLARPAPVSGRIIDESGQPLADVEVQFNDIEPAVGGSYEVAERRSYITDADGRFHAADLPPGKATIELRKDGYFTPGLIPPFKTPKANLDLHMLRAGSLRVTVDFIGREPAKDYVLEIEPEGGVAIGSFAGSWKIDDKHQGRFENVAPGRYVIKGHPSPAVPVQITEPLTVEVKAGQAEEVTLKAK